VDLPPDLLIPNIPAPQLALIEKDLDAGRTQRLANLLSGLRVLRGVAEKYRVRGLCNDGTTPELMRWRSCHASVCGSLAQVVQFRRAGSPADGTTGDDPKTTRSVSALLLVNGS
jgi:hypothetical protein